MKGKIVVCTEGKYPAHGRGVIAEINNSFQIPIIRRIAMTEALFAYAAGVLVIALIAGLLPVFSKIKQNPERLKMITSVASGIIIASAVLVIIPEGFALASEEDSHARDEALAGSIALVLLEVNDGDITEEEGLRQVVETIGVNWADAQATMNNAEWQPLLEENVSDMLAAGLWGVPSFRVSGGDKPPFSCWGQDRLWLVEAEIARRTK